MKPIEQLSEQELAQLVREAVALPDAPRELVAAAIKQWPEAEPSTVMQAAHAAIRRVVAALTFDSWAGATLAYGVRAVPSDSRHLLFNASGRDIDLRITPSAQQFLLAGQVLGPDESGTIELTSAQGIHQSDVRVASLNALGEFRLEGVGRGSYRLTIRFGEDEVVLPTIDVGESRR